MPNQDVSPDDERLLALVTKIADGTPIDWSAVEGITSSVVRLRRRAADGCRPTAASRTGRSRTRGVPLDVRRSHASR